MFEGFSKLLICGGYDPNINTCEAINLKSSTSTCKNPPNFPVIVHGAIQGIGLKENPLICGGEQNGSLSNSCYSLENNEWVSSLSMISERYAAAVAHLQDGKLLVTGGLFHNDAELLTDEGWERKIPSLLAITSFHCIVTVNSTTVMVIGGYQNSLVSGKTFFFTFGDRRWTNGPILKYERKAHICGKIRRDKESQDMSIIVAGGVGPGTANILSSVEILHEGSNAWQTGPELPFGILSSQMVESQNGGVVLIGGAKSIYSDDLDTLYQLPHGGQDAVWTKMEQKMMIGRQRHTAFFIPDNTVDCS